MQDLRVIGVENGALLVASVEGERFRIPIDEMMQSRLRQTLPEPNAGRKLSPREIQGHIRGGMSAEDVASVTGVPIDYIRKFEGPVLAEREFVVETALGVTVHTALDTDPASGSTFGVVITDRLAGLGAVDERWSSWKEEGTGWVIKLSFTADDIDHDARWKFDPKKLALAPLNSEAITLSQQGEPAGALIPRLRAVSVGSDSDREADSSRFDSGAFALDDLATDIGPGSGIRFANRAEPEPEAPHNQTADLLEALRRRRGEREAASYVDDEASAAVASEITFTSETIRIVGAPTPEQKTDTAPASPAPAPSASAPAAPTPPPAAPMSQTGPLSRGRKGRAAMPSWDDIVFGARPDDDLA